MKQLYLLILIFTVISINLLAQDETGLQKSSRVIKDRFPSTRLINLEYQTYSTHNFKSKLYKKDYQKGQITDYQYFRTSLNIPILKKKEWAISVSGEYKYETFNVKKSTFNNYTPSTLFSGKDTHYIPLDLTCIYSSM